MSRLTRRQVLLRLAGGVAAVVGNVILARSVLSETKKSETAQPVGPEERAEQLAKDRPPLSEGQEFTSFLNLGFRNGSFIGGGGWRNGWPNGGWRNGGWRNGGWLNGGGWKNGGWPNGGWGNGWRNWW
jgi:hypothetical protein